MDVTLYSIAERWLGTKELQGDLDNPQIRAWLAACGFGPEVHDEVAWCGAFTRAMVWQLGLPLPSYPARARQWLTVGTPVKLDEARIGFDVVVLARGGGNDWPPAEVLAAPGHVGIYGGRDPRMTFHDGFGVLVLGGNQSDTVSIMSFNPGRVLGVRRMWPLAAEAGAAA